MRFLRILIVPALIFAVWYFWPVADVAPIASQTATLLSAEYAVGDVIQVATGEQPVANVLLIIVDINGDQVTLMDVEGDRRTVGAEWLPNLQPLLSGMTDDEAMALWMQRYPGTTWIGPEDGDWLAYRTQPVTNYVPSHYPSIVRDALQYPSAMALQSWMQAHLQ